jgi:hypothetical protein
MFLEPALLSLELVVAEVVAKHPDLLPVEREKWRF